jgi:hypothetical protein
VIEGRTSSLSLQKPKRRFVGIEPHEHAKMTLSVAVFCWLALSHPRPRIPGFGRGGISIFREHGCRQLPPLTVPSGSGRGAATAKLRKNHPPPGSCGTRFGLNLPSDSGDGQEFSQNRKPVVPRNPYECLPPMRLCLCRHKVGFISRTVIRHRCHFGLKMARGRKRRLARHILGYSRHGATGRSRWTHLAS